MMNQEKKKRIKIVALISTVLVVAILAVLIMSKQVANPLTKNASKRAQFFVDLGNLLPKKKDTIRTGTVVDTMTNNATTTGSGSKSPTKDTNKDGVVNGKDAVIDTNKDGVVDNKDVSAELLEKLSETTDTESSPTPIPANNEEALKEIIKRDTIATKDLIITASTDIAKTKDQLTLSWSSPSKMEFANCVGSYAGGTYQQKELKSKGIKLTPYVQNALYGWDGKQTVPNKAQTKKTQMPYGDKEIIYVLTCEKKPPATLSSTEKVETGSGVFGKTESEADTVDTTPPKEYVVAQVALILDDGSFGNNGGGNSNTPNDCSSYPASVAARMPECNQNASEVDGLVLIASPEVVALGNTSTLYWFSPAGTTFTSCEGAGASESGQSATPDIPLWNGRKTVPDTIAPVQSFVVTPKNKDSRYAISCITPAGKTLRANANIQIQTNTGNELCEDLPANLKKIYCPDIELDIDLDQYTQNTTTTTCSNGTAGQNTPIILTADEQAEYEKLLRQFFRLLPQIRTPEAITAIGHDIEEVRNTGNYAEELTQLCWEQTQDAQNDLTPELSKCSSQAVPGIVGDLCQMPKRRVSPFFVSNEVIVNPDQKVASGDTGQFDAGARTPNQEFIIPWTHLNEEKFGANDRGYYFGINGKDFANPRAKANTDVFYSIGQQVNEFSDKDGWNDIQNALKNAFYYRPYAGYTYSVDGIGFNCNSDVRLVYVGYEFGKTNGGGTDGKSWDTIVKCGFSPWFEQIFGIGE